MRLTQGFDSRAQEPGLHTGSCYFKWMEGREWHEGRVVTMGRGGMLLASGGLLETKDATRYSKKHRTASPEQRTICRRGPCSKQVSMECS